MNIKNLRVRAGLTQQQLADLCRIHRVTLNRIESGVHNPSADTLRLLRDALHCTVDELLDERKTG